MASNHERKYIDSISLASTYGFGSTYSIAVIGMILTRKERFQLWEQKNVRRGLSVIVEHRGWSLKPFSFAAAIILLFNEFEVWPPIFYMILLL